MQCWRRRSRICKHIPRARQRLDELLLGEGHIDHTRTRQAHKLTAVLVSIVQCARRQTFWKMRLRTVAASLDDTACGSRSNWLGGPSLACAATSSAQVMARLAGGKHDWRWSGSAPLIREPIGFQAARGNAVDEQLKLHKHGQPFGARVLRAQCLPGRRMTGPGHQQA